MLRWLPVKGTLSGSINRIISPSELGEIFKPFVFLDCFRFHANEFKGFKSHPHSGIATLTYMISGSSHYSDTTGKFGELQAGSVEWMQAGGGVWHANSPMDNSLNEGYQLWIALPPELELSPPQSQYISPENVPQFGPAKVVLGEYGGQRSPIDYPLALTLLYVELEAGENWQYTVSDARDFSWCFVSEGRLQNDQQIGSGEAVLFNITSNVISFTALEKTHLLIGSSTLHPHDLSLGYYSVHTQDAALKQGEANIMRFCKEGIKLNTKQTEKR